jgi:20S proteasome subunit beta 1
MILELMDMIILQINADGVSRKFHPGDKLQLWHEELEPQNSLLDILAAGNPDPMVQ